MFLPSLKQKLALAILLQLFIIEPADAQKSARVQPVWWFGQSAGVNFNKYRGTTQNLNKGFSAPAAFHKGDGIKPYASLLTEYRPSKVWGGGLQIAFDNRGGGFDEVMAPCDCPANLATNLSYIAIEPSLRVAPFSSPFYLFGGPTLGINISRTFDYRQEKQADRRADWSDIRKTVLSAQVGAGYDIPLSAPASATQMTLSPFASFHTNLGQAPRSTESWSIYTMRAGIALKLGTSRKAAAKAVAITPVAPLGKELQFSVRAPKVLPSARQVKETFPLRNSVFFDKTSTAIPARYMQLTNAQAGAFKEAQLQEAQPQNLGSGRSARQLAVYHNILNIIGDRLRSNPQSAILLSGAADRNADEGKVLAENVRQYLVERFGVDGARIRTEGREKPMVPSEQPGATTELALLKEGDRRVDIFSTSPELLLQVGGVTSDYLKPVQIISHQQDPLDSHVIFKAEGAEDLLTSWTVDVTNEAGGNRQFGPFTGEQASVSGKTILGNDAAGNYKIQLTGTTKTGGIIRKESSVSLVKPEEAKQEGLRYSILFDFDKANSIASYEQFLTDIVLPLIPSNSSVLIHGHTDAIGDAAHNHALSHQRARSTEQILQKGLAGTDRRGVKFETLGFGEELHSAPFENRLPEERFYNRTVIIDIVAN